MPMGSSSGGNKPLAITSDPIKNIAPINDDNKISFLWSLPTKVLHMWGTTSPIKPIDPVTAINADVNSVVNSRSNTLIHLTLIPSIIALVSPTNKISSDLERKNVMIITIQNIINGNNKISHFAPPKLPTVQKSAVLAWLVFGDA